MAYYNRHFRPFVGGSEEITAITHYERQEAREPKVPMDLSGYSIGAEVWWDGCLRVVPGIEIGDLVAGEPHYTVILSEAQTAIVPLGRIAWMKLIRELDGVTTVIAPIWLERTA